MTVFLWIIASIWLAPLAIFAAVSCGCGLSRRWRLFWREQLVGHRDAGPPWEP